MVGNRVGSSGVWFEVNIWKPLAYFRSIYRGMDEISQIECVQRKAEQKFMYSFYKFIEHLPCSRCYKYNSEHETYLLLMVDIHQIHNRGSERDKCNEEKESRVRRCRVGGQERALWSGDIWANVWIHWTRKLEESVGRVFQAKGTSSKVLGVARLMWLVWREHVGEGQKMRVEKKPGSDHMVL